MTRIDYIYRICYVVVHRTPVDDGYSLFQGFGRELLETSVAFKRIATLPRDARELWIDRDHRILLGATGIGARVHPIQLDSLREFLGHLVDRPQPFLCVCSPRFAASDVSTILEGFDQPILHVPYASAAGRYAGLTYDAIRDYVAVAARHLAGDPTLGPVGDAVARALYEAIPPIMCELPIRSMGHQLWNVNETTLVRLDYSLEPWDGVPIKLAEEAFAGAVSESARLVLDARREFFERHHGVRAATTFDAILTAPSLLRSRYGADFRRQLRARRDGEHKAGQETRKRTEALRALSRSFATQTGYLLRADGRHASAMIETTEGRALIQERNEELGAYTTALQIRAGTDFVPIVRVPAGVNALHDEVRRVTDAARATGANRLRRLNMFARELSAALTAHVPPELLEIVDEAGSAIKVVADAPLEWLDVGGAPLLVRKAVSRIPTTPGNAFLLETLGFPDEHVTLGHAARVLLVRSFEDDDPIRDLLFNYCRGVLALERAAGRRVVELDVVDVGSHADLVAALNAFDGAVMIFDGHGAHDRNDEVGTIAVGRDRVDAWSLRADVRVPPVVVLSACDTHPLDGSHASVAAGFLVGGARTVLASTMPVTAPNAADFIGRLLLRMNQWLPIALDEPPGNVRWSRLVTGLQHRVHMTEVMRALEGKNGIRLLDDAFERLGVRVGLMIEAGDPNWRNALLRGVAEECGADPDVVYAAAREWAFITDALRYIQLGNPESVVITNADPTDP